MRVYHGSTSWKVVSLADGRSSRWPGLYVTDTSTRAQLYADAQASGVVETYPRYCADSVVVELETPDVVWSRRPDNHPSLDKCEAVIEHWRIVAVTVYAAAYDLEHGIMKVGNTYRKTYDYLRECFGNKLTIVTC